MTVRPVVNKIYRGQKIRIIQFTGVVKEEFSLLSMNIALDLSSISTKLMKGDACINIFMVVLHVEHLKNVGEEVRIVWRKCI